MPRKIIRILIYEFLLLCVAILANCYLMIVMKLSELCEMRGGYTKKLIYVHMFTYVSASKLYTSQAFRFFIIFSR